MVFLFNDFYGLYEAFLSATASGTADISISLLNDLSSPLTQASSWASVDPLIYGLTRDFPATLDVTGKVWTFGGYTFNLPNAVTFNRVVYYCTVGANSYPLVLCDTKVNNQVATVNAAVNSQFVVQNTVVTFGDAA